MKPTNCTSPKTCLTVANATLLPQIEQLLAEGRRVRITVVGDSMRPFLRPKFDSVELTAAVGSRIRRGDVLLCRYRSGFVLHRVRRIKGESLTLAGDWNCGVVETLPRENVVACVTSVRRVEREIARNSAAWLALSWYSLAVKSLRRIYVAVFC